MDFEPLYEAWERFKDLIRRCPQHGYQEWFQIQLFYKGLNGKTQTIVNVAASGSLLSKIAEEAYRLLEEMSANNFQWPSECSLAKKATRVHEVDPIITLSAQVSALANQIVAFTTREALSSKESTMVASSSYTGEGVDQEQCQYVNNQNFNYCPNNMPTHYHPRLHNHENFSYANPRKALQLPSGFEQSIVEKKPSIEDLLSTFIIETRGRF